MEGFSLLEVLGRGRLVEEEVPPIHFISALTTEHHLKASRLDLPRQDVHRHTCAHLRHNPQYRLENIPHGSLREATASEQHTPTHKANSQTARAVKRTCPTLYKISLNFAPIMVYICYA